MHEEEPAEYWTKSISEPGLGTHDTSHSTSILDGVGGPPEGPLDRRQVTLTIEEILRSKWELRLCGVVHGDLRLDNLAHHFF